MPTAKPAPAEQFDDMGQQRRAGLMGMWVFLVTELLLFGGGFAVFAMYRVQHPQVFAEAAGHLSLPLATANTVLLLTSGLTMALAEQAVEAGRRRLTLVFYLATMALGLGFLGVKGFEWYLEWQAQLMPLPGLVFNWPGNESQQAELFFNFYFILTGLHALHMVIGLGLLGVMVVLVQRWRDPHRLARQTQISGLYWAFVDVIWLFLFTTLYLLGP